MPRSDVTILALSRAEIVVSTPEAVESWTKETAAQPEGRGCGFHVELGRWVVSGCRTAIIQSCLENSRAKAHDGEL